MIQNLIAYFTNPLTRSLGLGYFGMSILFGTWASRIPDIQRKLSLDESDIGFALLGMSLGAFIMTFLAGWLIEKLGTSTSMMIGLFGMSSAILLPALASGLIWLFLGLFFFGTFNGYLNITVNNAVAEYERQKEIVIMSTGHAIFSLGAMLGAGLGTLFVKMEVIPFLHFLCIVLLIYVLSFFAYAQFKKLPEGKIEDQGFQWPTLAISALIIIGLCAMMGEGVVASWAAIFLEVEKNVAPHLSPLAFTAFSGTMAIGRLLGDWLKEQFGTKTLLAIACALAGSGLFMGILTNSAIVSIVGFAITGLGYSVIVPIVFSMAANTPGVKPTAGIAMVSGAGVLGFLGAPPLIGFISEYVSLGTGFALIAGFAYFALLIVLLKK